MRTTNTTHRHSLTTTIWIVTLLVAASPVATPFGDNDGGLDLPGMQEPGNSGPGNGSGGGGSGGTSNQSSAPGSTFGVITVSGSDILVVETPDPVRGQLTLSTDLPISMSIVTTSTSGGEAQATQSTGDGVSASSDGVAIILQGGASLPAESQYDRHLVGPVDAAVSVALLLVDSDPGAGLDALLDGEVMLDDWRLVDVPGSLDLDEFAGWATKKAGKLSPTGADVRVTWVIATLDSQGELHLSAARVSTQGGEIEVITR